MERAGLVAAHVRARLAGDVTGRVRHVFRSSCNVELGGRLVHIGPDTRPLSCIGLVVPPEVLVPALGGLRAGDIVTVRAGVLRLFSMAGVVAVRLDELVPVSCAVPGALDEAGRTRLAGALELDRLFAAAGLERTERLASCLARIGDAAIPLDAALEAASLLIGRGHGLTPSGDDMLLGCCTGLALGGHAQWAHELAAGVDLARTTEVSAAYLAAFAEGHVNPQIRELAAAAAAGEGARMRRVLEGIRRIGHTSGADMLVGLAAGLGLLCDQAV